MARPPAAAPPAAVGLILTGGTVGSQLRWHADEPVVSLAPAAEGEPAGLHLVRSAVPDGWRVRFTTVSPLSLASEDMCPADWRTIAENVRTLARSGLSRVLILHGTDTMGFTAAALSFMLSDVDVTVVLTGANLPPGQAGSDAGKNVHDALLALTELPRGTYIAFAGGADLPSLVHLGTQVRKVQAYGQAYRSVNRRPVARVAGGVLTWIDPWQPVPPPAVPGNGSGAGMLSDPDGSVLSFRLYPGLDLSAMARAVDAGRCRAVVVELYAAVTGPSGGGAQSLPAFVRRCRTEGVCVFLTASGRMVDHANMYDSYVALRDAGGVYLPGMIPETAIVKCMWALGRTADPASLTALMRTPLAGEVSTDTLGRPRRPPAVPQYASANAKD